MTPSTASTDQLTTAALGEAVTDIVQRVRTESPLVQVITNFVSMDLAANVLNAVGASPAMVHDARESGEFAAIASALCVNIGTPSPSWAAGMTAAVEGAVAAGTPWVLDPVAVGATAYRRELVAGLLEHSPAVIRGNAGEILSIATSANAGRGVDSLASSDDAVEAARDVARRYAAVVVVSGRVDVVTDGDRVVRLHGGDDRMPMVTALGCSASALVGATLGVAADRPLEAALAAMAMLAVAGERAGARAEGPGSLRVALLDELAALDRGRTGSARIEVA
jgi:hydroxyethylthiazole kinase